MAMNKIALLLATLGTLGCSGSTPAANSADGAATPGPSGGTSARGSQCLTDAGTSIDVPANAPARVELRHILVRHGELADPKGATRSREDACLAALDALEALQKGTLDWDAAVARYSDAKDSELGRVAVDELDPAFAGAAFSLEVDQLSYVVETPRGFHVILRRR